MAQNQTSWPRAAVLTFALLVSLGGGGDADAAPPVIHPPPPNYGIIGMSWYMDYTGSKGGTHNPYRQLWTAGGLIPLQGSEWRCEHTPVATTVVTLPTIRTNQVHRVAQDTVDLKCTYDGRSVTSSVSCFHNDDQMGSTSLNLSNGDGKSFYVSIHCAYLNGKSGAR